MTKSFKDIVTDHEAQSQARYVAMQEAEKRCTTFWSGTLRPLFDGIIHDWQNASGDGSCDCSLEHTGPIRNPFTLHFKYRGKSLLQVTALFLPLVEGAYVVIKGKAKQEEWFLHYSNPDENDPENGIPLVAFERAHLMKFVAEGLEGTLTAFLP